MKIDIIAVGVLKQTPEKQLINHYLKQFFKSHRPSVIEVHCKKVTTKEEEGNLILEKIDSSSYIIALDEKGCSITTQNFYNILYAPTHTYSKITFIIGGANGLSYNFKTKAHKTICFGGLTWPHMLVRVMLVEQIYRCYQIKQNHPYHRE